jgi:hypothetical protein
MVRVATNSCWGADGKGRLMLLHGAMKPTSKYHPCKGKDQRIPRLLHAASIAYSRQGKGHLQVFDLGLAPSPSAHLTMTLAL